MGAHWVVLAAAVLTTLVASVLATAFAVFVAQALPLAVRYDLAAAPGTSLLLSGPVGPNQAAQDSAALGGVIRSALHGAPFGFYRAYWSDPLGLVAGSLPSRPADAGQGNVPLIQAGSLSGLTSRAVLVAGHWPAAPSAACPSGAASGQADGGHGGSRPAPAGPVIPAALPSSVAALLRLAPGDVLGLRDRISGQLVRFRLTGLFAMRHLSGPAASYWELNIVGPGGVSTAGGFTTYGPLVVSQAAFAGPLEVDLGSWVAQPDMARLCQCRPDRDRR
jgi:hypothetical protein